MKSLKKLTVDGSRKFSLADHDPDADFGIKDKAEARGKLATIQAQLEELQERLFAGRRHAVLVVLQAMDTGGKDGTIRKVFGPLNPQGVRVTGFKAPTPVELAHDFLWRVHAAVPSRGMIGVFNRSHYEDVLIVRVHDWAPGKVIARRYGQINAFERHLAANDVTILKFFLHISKDEQKRRLQARLDNPEKHWKFNAGDLAERKLWDDYMGAYEKAIGKCASSKAPWFVIPADTKWRRDLLIARIMLEAMQKLDLAFPDPEPDLENVVIED